MSARAISLAAVLALFAAGCAVQTSSDEDNYVIRAGGGAVGARDPQTSSGAASENGAADDGQTAVSSRIVHRYDPNMAPQPDPWKAPGNNGNTPNSGGWGGGGSPVEGGGNGGGAVRGGAGAIQRVPDL